MTRVSRLTRRAPSTSNVGRSAIAELKFETLTTRMGDAAVPPFLLVVRRLGTQAEYLAERRSIRDSDRGSRTPAACIPGPPESCPILEAKAYRHAGHRIAVNDCVGGRQSPRFILRPAVDGGRQAANATREMPAGTSLSVRKIRRKRNSLPSREEASPGSMQVRMEAPGCLSTVSNDWTS